MKVDKTVLLTVSCKLVKKENYFLNHWKYSSAAVSFFKTEETERLDAAFIAHSKNEKSDKALMTDLDTWLKNKETSNSKRYNLVYQIRDELRIFSKNSGVVQQKKCSNEQQHFSLGSKL